MIEVFVIGAGLRGPGLAGWGASVAVLAGRRKLSPEPPSLPPPAILAANERRRTGTVVRLALAVAQEAAEMAGVAAGAMTSVFASANGDGTLVHAILEQLGAPEPQVSPTQFHNSVHNAAAGYWSIGTGATRAASCLGCHEATAAAALLRAAAEVAVEERPVLLCLYDAPMPEPLARVRPTRFTFGAALVLAPRPHQAALGRLPIARLRLDWNCDPAGAASVPKLAALRTLHAENPAAGLLPLLEALADGTACVLALPLLDGQVAVEVEPLVQPVVIRALMPHCGAMVLLDEVVRWDAAEAVCAVRSHLDPANPLRRAGRLGAACGIEYGLQAAAVHGALLAGGVRQPAGLLAALRGVAWHVERLDDPGFGTLGVTARLEGRDAGGLAYAFRLTAADGSCLVEGRGLIALAGHSRGSR